MMEPSNAHSLIIRNTPVVDNNALIDYFSDASEYSQRSFAEMYAIFVIRAFISYGTTMIETNQPGRWHRVVFSRS